MAEACHCSSGCHDSEKHSTNGGYCTEFDCDQTCLTSGGCLKDYDTDNDDWKSEESYSEPEIDSDAETNGLFRNYKSWMETGVSDTRAYKEQGYLGCDELSDHDSDVRGGRTKQMRTRRRQRSIRVS